MGLLHRRQNNEKEDGIIDARTNSVGASANSHPERVSLRERIKHFTWAQFTLPLSTGGIALVLSATPHRFLGLDTIGKIFFIFALVIFAACVTAISLRFTLNPGTLRNSLVHPTEALFTPTLLLSVATLTSCIQAYGGPSCGPWLTTAIEVLYWIYVALAFTAAVFQYLFLFAGPRLTIQSMTPAWILPVFPIMLSATIATLISPSLSPSRRMPVIVAGVGFQGLGWMIAFLMYAIYTHRMMSYGLPAPDLRPGMFIPVGPPSFTGLVLIGLAKALPEDYGYFASRPIGVEVVRTMADFTAIFLWVLAFWFFCIALVAVLLGARKMSFHMVWWAGVFPNTGFAINTISIGEQLESEGILWVGSAMTILLVAAWIFIFLAQMMAIWRKQILMPGKDEDKEYYKEDDEKHGVQAPPPPPSHSVP